MKKLNALPIKRTPKRNRELQVLFGLVEHYIKTGKPVGSDTLKESSFDSISSATIRNYFSQLESEGFLTQSHLSGGRIPTHKAYRAYAQSQIDSIDGQVSSRQIIQELQDQDSREVALYLQNAAEKLSNATNMAIFLSAPRFDQDYVASIKLVSIDNTRCLAVIVTDFGVIRTEVIYTEQKLSVLALKRIESYFYWRLTGHERPENFSGDEEELAKRIYNELMMRYLVNYSNFVDAELYRTGLSNLLSYPEFFDSTVLAEGLALFENAHSMRLLVRECCKHNRLMFWIGDDLSAYTTKTPDCSVVAIPYYINNHVVGAIGLLGPTRMSYSSLFGVMLNFSKGVSETLTKKLFKHKITFRQPLSNTFALEHKQLKISYKGKE